MDYDNLPQLSFSLMGRTHLYTVTVTHLYTVTVYSGEIVAAQNGQVGLDVIWPYQADASDRKIDIQIGE